MSGELGSLLDDYVRASVDWPIAFGHSLDDSPEAATIVAAPPAIQTAIVVDGVERLVGILVGGGDFATQYWLAQLVSRLLRRRLPFGPDETARICRMLAASPTAWRGYVPVPALIKAVGRAVDTGGLTPEVASALEDLHRRGRELASSADEIRAIATIPAILGVAPTVTDPIDPLDDWGHAARAALAALDDPLRSAWTAVLVHAAGATGSTPSASWLRAGRASVEEIGEQRFVELVTAWLALVGSAPTAPIDPSATREDAAREWVVGVPIPSSILTPRNSTIVRGLAWLTTTVAEPALARALGDAAVHCFRKIPQVGARATKAGNGCIWALGAMGSDAGAAELVTLRERVSYREAWRLIEAALESAATRLGLTTDDLVDRATPTFELIDARRTWQLDGHRAELRVHGPRHVAVSWFDPDGRERRSLPNDVKRAHPEEVRAITRTAADLRTALSAQRDRIERLLGMERSWPVADWRRFSVDHPLLGCVTRSLVFRFVDKAGADLGTGMFRDGVLLGPDDRPLDVSATARVSLWHPITASLDLVESWQAFLARHQVTQPFAQAHREVYRPTDAERDAGARSRRFAGHILRQHQLHALCRDRDWVYRLQSEAFDGANSAIRGLPGGLEAAFEVTPLETGGHGLSAAFVSLYVRTGAVTFARASTRPTGPPRSVAALARRMAQPVDDLTVPLLDVPAVVFSETMRDIDLFVGVASVGADPAFDAPDEDAAAYWASQAFGDLSEVARTRRATLAGLLPQLPIADRCDLEDRFLRVRGDLNVYRIHLGSGNVLADPGSRYVCIVPARAPVDADPTLRLYLPFEGDGTLAVIVSKALLLADDASISDPAIRSQLVA